MFSITVTEAESIEIDAAAAFATGDEMTAKPPIPKATIAIDAIRFLNVFVDICFLSIKVDPRAFPESAWLRSAFSSDMSAPFFRVVDKREVMRGAG